MSNFFPKYSPDGKWIVFCKAKSYMLLQPDSELYIVPADGRRRATPALQHRAHELLAQLVVEQPLAGLLVEGERGRTRSSSSRTSTTHGNDSPPVLLERFTSPDRAANIPEFVKLSGDAIADIREQFLDPYSFLRAGMANEHTGDHAGAERAYRRGLELAPDDAELRNALGWTLFQDGPIDGGGGGIRASARGESATTRRRTTTWRSRWSSSAQLEEAAGHFTGIARDRAQGGDLQRPRIHHGAARQIAARRSPTTRRRSSSTRAARRRT